MKIVVIVKEVPDTEARIGLKDGRPELSGTAMVLNPYDEYAIEEALRQAEKNPGSSVTLVMAGTEASKKSIINALAMGVDEAVLIADPALEGSDQLQIARALKAAVAPLSPDFVIGGKQGVDYDYGLGAIALAHELGWPHVGVITKLELSGGAFKAESDSDEGKLVTEGALPAVFTAEKALNEPRYASLKGIMAAKKKPLTVKTLADLALNTADFGAAGAKVQMVGCEYPKTKAAGRMIEGETVQEKVANLVKALREEAKVI
jgi:electron transfer flavoprotein beta subunit